MEAARSVTGKPLRGRVAEAGVCRPPAHQVTRKSLRERSVEQDEHARSCARQRRPSRVVQRRIAQERRQVRARPCEEPTRRNQRMHVRRSPRAILEHSRGCKWGVWARGACEPRSLRQLWGKNKHSAIWCVRARGRFRGPCMRMTCDLMLVACQWPTALRSDMRMHLLADCSLRLRGPGVHKCLCERTVLGVGVSCQSDRQGLGDGARGCDAERACAPPH